MDSKVKININFTGRLRVKGWSKSCSSTIGFVLVELYFLHKDYAN